jgi:hypothetical protein
MQNTPKPMTTNDRRADEPRSRDIERANAAPDSTIGGAEDTERMNWPGGSNGDAPEEDRPDEVDSSDAGGTLTGRPAPTPTGDADTGEYHGPARPGTFGEAATNREQSGISGTGED